MSLGGATPPEKRPLEELMLAMDVVDTLRHRELIVERELNTEERDRKLIERLREVYAAQGIEVDDRVLAEGVDALREDRFSYQPPKPGLSVWLAKLYVKRGAITKVSLIVVAVIAVLWGGYSLLVSGPAERRLAAMPQALQAQYQGVLDVTDLTDVEDQAKRIADRATAALAEGETDRAQKAIDELGDLRARLERQFELQIVSRPDELSGVWRIPDRNPDARNYYIIVEAVGADGKRLELPIRSEEDGRIHTVDRWGLRVDETTFRRIAADKNDDGIIQDNIFGVKRAGDLDPEYFMATTGAAITSW